MIKVVSAITRVLPVVQLVLGNHIFWLGHSVASTGGLALVIGVPLTGRVILDELKQFICECIFSYCGAAGTDLLQPCFI